MAYSVDRSAIVPFSAHQMFTLVCDVESYPEFLTWCKSAKVFETSEDLMIAELTVSYRGLDMAFTTNNNLLYPQSVSMTLNRGPFKALDGQWHFKALSDTACKVSLAMTFSFDNSIMQRVFGRMFQHLVSEQLNAFQTRANGIYVGV